MKPRGERAAARDVLSPVYGSMREGFDCDVLEARAFLNELHGIGEE